MKNRTPPPPSVHARFAIIIKLQYCDVVFFFWYFYSRRLKYETVLFNYVRPLGLWGFYPLLLQMRAHEISHIIRGTIPVGDNAKYIIANWCCCCCEFRFDNSPALIYKVVIIWSYTSWRKGRKCENAGNAIKVKKRQNDKRIKIGLWSCFPYNLFEKISYIFIVESCSGNILMFHTFFPLFWVKNFWFIWEINYFHISIPWYFTRTTCSSIVPIEYQLLGLF